MKLSRQLRQLHACKEAYKWVGKKTLTEAWATCERGDWMLWYAAKVNIDRKSLMKAACACARLALPYLPSDELRPARAIETAERWIDGGATVDEVRNAADAAYAAASAYATVAADASYAATAAYAAASAYTVVATVTAAAATATAAAVAVAAAGTIYNITLKRCADIVRAIIPVETLEDK